MKKFFLSIFILGLINLTIIAEEVTFNDFEEITHESKPALQHKKTKEIYRLTFSNFFYSEDKQVYAMLVDAKKTTSLQNESHQFRFLCIMTIDNKRLDVCMQPLWTLSEIYAWHGDFVITISIGLPPALLYYNYKTKFSYWATDIAKSWISDTEFWYVRETGQLLGDYDPNGFTHCDVYKRILVGANDGITKPVFLHSNFNNFLIKSSSPQIIILNSYFNFYSEKNTRKEQFQFVVNKHLEVDKSGKILSTTIPPDQYGVCLADNVRVRTSPDLNGTVVGHLKKDDTFEILDASETTQVIDTMEAYWYKIKNKTLSGWVYGYFIIGKPAEKDNQ